MTRTTYTLTGLNFYRDGSLEASFRREDGRRFALHLGVARWTWTGDWDQRPFDAPILEKTIEAPYTSPVTGITDMDYRYVKRRITWNAARHILARMRHQIDGFDADDREIFDEMLRVAARCGQQG